MEPDADTINLTIYSDPRYLGLLRKLVEKAARRADLTGEEVQGVMLAVNEGCANIIQHCYGMSGGNRIDVEIRVLGDRLEIDLRDYGDCQLSRAPEPDCCDDREPGGLGLRIIDSVMDEVRFRPAESRGTLLTMVKYRSEGRT
jgi:serine/threonine-protein kinase RsbW